MRLTRASAGILFVVICGLLSPVDGVAQTTGVLRGKVLDDSGAPLSGVVIAVSNASRGIAGVGAITDASGTFVVPGLPSSRDYRITASLPGFATVVLSDVDVSAGRVNEVAIVLSPETKVRERVEVRARPNVVSIEETTTQTSLSSEFVDALPILGRDYQDILTLAPGVSDVDGDGNPNIHGARDTDVITLVDGVSTSDPLTGKIGAQLNIESIQEIQVKTSGAGAEYGRAQGGFADIVTKSGGNDFQGTFKFYWRGSALDGDGAGTDDPRLHAGVGENGLRDLRFNDYMPFLSLSGPLAKDKAWFYVALEYIHQEDPVNSLNAAFLRGVEEWRDFAKFTWQASPGHRLALSVNYDPQQYLNQGLNSFTREETGYTLKAGGTIATLKSTAVLSPLATLETSASFFDQNPAIVPNLGPDTNGNGFLWTDVNHDGMREAFEGDPGEDYDGDGKFDVFEDANYNHLIEAGEDKDHDGRLTVANRYCYWVPGVGCVWGYSGACEGALREDRNCNGMLDHSEDVNHNGILDPGEDINHNLTLDPGEDLNHNGILDPGEDLNHNGILDPDEDRNHNGRLDDTLVPASLYPYGELRPTPADRGYSIDRDTGITSGPYYQEFSDSRQRFTLRTDLGVYLPDFHGTHDIKTGVVFERESFDRRAEVRPVSSIGVITCEPPLCFPPEGTTSVPPLPTISVLLPDQSGTHAEAAGLTTGLYVQDTYRPVPNLSLGLGVRFERELDSTAGYTSFDPAVESRNFERLIQLGGLESGSASSGIRGDPFFKGQGDVRQAAAFITDPLQIAALGRLTRPHSAVGFETARLSGFGILPPGQENDPAVLARYGVTPQEPETFAITNNNLSPRLSVAWDPWSEGRSKLFATWGRYFDKLFLSTIVGEQDPGQVNRYYVYDQAGVTRDLTPDNHIGAVISKAPPSVTQVDRNLATPFSDELTLGFERELAPEVALSVTYIDRRYRQQLQDIDVNHFLRYDAAGRPLDQLGTMSLVGSVNGIDFGSTHRAPDGHPDLYIHDLFFNQVLRVGNFNEARYKGIEVAVTRRLAHAWQMQASYTYSRAAGDAEDFQSRLGNDPSTVEWESGYLDYDQRHVVKLNAALFLPHDWQVGTAITWGSGLPYSVISRFFAFDNVDYQQYRTRYGYTGQDLKFVPMRRNSERNDPVLDVDLHARRQFVLGRCSAGLSLEVFNLLNRDNLRIFSYEPNPFSSGGFAGGSALTPRGPLQVNGERSFGRRFQVGFRIDF